MPPTTHDMPRRRVLVVEDNEKLALLLCRALGEDDFEPEAAFDGLTAICRLSTAPYEAVLLDIGLPGLSGLEVCAALRRSGSTMPVLMVSARDGIDDVEQARRAGATDYFFKPFSLDELTARVEDLIRASSRSHGQLIDAA